MLKNLKSLFIVTEPEAEGAAPAEGEREGRPSAKPLSDRRTGAPASPARGTTEAPAGRPSARNPTPRPAPEAARAKGTVNAQIVERLLDAVDTNDLEGFDYLEYKRSLQAMASLPMDEATRYRSAFATASTVGATVEKLLSSVDYYLHVLEKERSSFDGVVERQFGEQVGDRRGELEAIDARIAEKEERIRALQSEIEQHRADATSIADGIAAAEAKIQNTKIDFGASYDYVRQLFTADAEKMRQYLK